MQPTAIKNIFKGYYSIPDYQRDYEWKNSQTSTLFDDIRALFDVPNETTHFIGAIVTIPLEKDYSTHASINFADYGIDCSNVKHVIDGQQRLTTFCLLVAALRDVIMSDDSIDGKKKDKFPR